jgi:hypothetical protein
MFQKAERIQKKLRLAITGLSGSGKTYSALALASHLGKKVAVIDTENNSSTLYAEYFDFDVCNLGQFHPNKYIEAITFAGDAGYDVIVVDSLSHVWNEILNIVGGNYNNWAKVRPLEDQLKQAMLRSPSHIIVTMREKADYVDGTSKTGKATKVKAGTKPVMSDGIEYEFDIAGQMDLSHTLSLTKSRCKALQDTTWTNPGKDLAEVMKEWLAQGNAAVDQSVNQLVTAKNEQSEGFKNACKLAGMTPIEAKTLLKRYGVSKAAELTAEQYQSVLELITESSAA